MIKLIIISAQIRTGSTFLWHLFKISNEVTAYFEPDLLNLFDFMRYLPRPRNRLHHYHVDSYWNEYAGLRDLPKIHAGMANELENRHCLGAYHKAPNFKIYLDYLIKKAPQTPLFQVNRCNFRLLWIKHNFPSSVIVHLWRNPHDQWASMILGIRPEYITNEMKINERNLKTIFPILAKTKHIYQFFFLHHRLSRIYGETYSDLSICYDKLKSEKIKHFSQLFRNCGIRRITPEMAASLFVNGQRKGYDVATNEWFMEHEAFCNDLWEQEYGNSNVAETIKNQIDLRNQVQP